MPLCTATTLALLCQLTDADAKAAADVVVGEMKRTEVVPHSTVFASVIAGYHGDVAGFGELRVGYGKGRFKRNLLWPSMTMWRVSAAVRGFYGRADGVQASLLAGWGKVAPLGITLEAGVDGTLTDERAFGPIASLGIRVGHAGLHTTVWTHVTGDTNDAGFTIGLGWTFKDWLGPADVAKLRATEELKIRGVPLP